MAAPHPLAELIPLVSPYDCTDLLAALAALQLMPENAGRAIRIEVLSHATASLPDKAGRPAISQGGLKRITAAAPVSSLATYEDPVDNAFTEALPFFGGSYTVFPGISETPTFIVDCLARAIFFPSPGLPHAAFRSESYDILRAGLVLGNEVARRAGLERNVGPAAGPADGSIVVPNAATLRELKKAVVFTESELTGVLAAQNSKAGALAAVTIAMGAVRPDSYDMTHGDLLSRPLVGGGGKIILAVPGSLLAALKNVVIGLAKKHGVMQSLAQRYGDVMWQAAKHFLSFLQNEAVYVKLPPLDGPACVREGVFALDTDKLVHVQLVVNDFENYDSERPAEGWDLEKVEKPLTDRLVQIRDHLSQKEGAAGVLSLILLGGIGRQSILALGGAEDSDQCHIAILGTSDLRTIALLEGGDRLALWKFCKARRRLTKHTSLAPTGMLNEFFYYRRSQHSFYITDEKSPDHLSLDFSGRGELQREMLAKYDFHAVPSYNESAHTEVALLHGTRDVPIFAPFRDMGRRVTVMTDALSVPIWVIGPEYGNSGEPELHSVYAQLADAIVYWLWQLRPSLGEVSWHGTEAASRIVISLRLLEGAGWSGPVPPSETTPVSVEVDEATHTMEVSVHSSFSGLLAQSNNSGERLLMLEVLKGLRLLVPSQVQVKWDDEALGAAIDRDVPLGKKKKAFCINTQLNPELDPTGLPPYRPIQDADEQELLEELGEYLHGSLGLVVGPIPEDQQGDILHKVVEYFYGQLQQLVRSLAPQGVLEWLIGSYEAAVYRAAFDRITTTTRIECFGHESETVEMMVSESKLLTRTSVAGRFAVEYVAACPPTGSRRMSLEVYDRMQALACLIADFGFLSDLLQEKLCDFRLEVLSSRRLAWNRDEFDKVRRTYLTAQTESNIFRRSRTFDRHFVVDATSTPPDELQERVDAAFKAEFGLTLIEIAEVVGEMLKLGYELTTSPKILEWEAACGRIAADLHWPTDKVLPCLDLLSLASRPDFLKPPEPYSRRDVYPWRFSRPLSYLRRPLVKREIGSRQEVLWGNRHLHRSMSYLVDAFLGGRMKGNSREMRELVGEFHDERGKNFNSLVADLFQGKPGIIVKSCVKKIGFQRLPGELGDIDVLVFDARRCVIRLVECKDLAVGRTPHEVRTELDELLLGRPGHKSDLARHEERLAWARDHLDNLLEWVHLPAKKRWKVEGLVVVDEELFSPHIHRSSIPITSFATLAQQLKGD